MPASAYQVVAVSDPNTQFTEALGVGDISANVDLVLPSKTPWWFIKAFTLIATQNCAYELQLFSRAANNTGVIATTNFIGAWQFNEMQAGPPAYPGYPVTGNGLFNFYIDGNFIPYRDLDYGSDPTQGSPLLHVRLVSRAGSKSADAAGALQLTAYCAPQGMQV